mgnify:CR=1 FL=1
MSEQAPFLTEVTFYCPECGRKRKAEVKVWVILEKNCFAFACKDCRNWWIIDIKAALGAKATRPGESPPLSEPQVQIINRITSELQPKIRKEISERNAIRIVKSIGKTIEVQPLGKLKIERPDLFGAIGAVPGWHRGRADATKVKLGMKMRGLKK